MSRYLYTIILCFFISLSHSQKMDLPEDRSLKPVNLPFKVNEIKITDARVNKVPMDWDVASLSNKKEFKGHPELSKQNKEDIERIIRSSQPEDDGVPANFEIILLEGEFSLKSDPLHVREYTKVKAELNVSIPSRSSKVGATAEGNYENAIFDGSIEHMMALYNLVIRNVTAELLKEIKDSVKQ